MTRRKQNPNPEVEEVDEVLEPEEVVESEEVIETYNDIDEIETVLKTVPEPTKVNSGDGDVPNNNDVMLPRSASRYVPPLR